jgi:hypothetical protein
MASHQPIARSKVEQGGEHSKGPQYPPYCQAQAVRRPKPGLRAWEVPLLHRDRTFRESWSSLADGRRAGSSSMHLAIRSHRDCGHSSGTLCNTGQ